MIPTKTVHPEKQNRFTLTGANIIMHPQTHTASATLPCKRCCHRSAPPETHTTLLPTTRASPHSSRTHISLPADLHTYHFLPKESTSCCTVSQTNHSVPDHAHSRPQSRISWSPCAVVPTHSPSAARNISLSTLSPCYLYSWPSAPPDTYIALLPTIYGTSRAQQTHRRFCIS